LCVQCGQCLGKCPQQIDIPAELARAEAILGQRAWIDDLYER
jgi:predicted aldo/keto reductase-like oxidoreductase